MCRNLLDRYLPICVWDDTMNFFIEFTAKLPVEANSEAEARHKFAQMLLDTPEENIAEHAEVTRRSLDTVSQNSFSLRYLPH